MSYGLWEFGGGTGVYRPLTKDTPQENTIVNKAIKLVKATYKDAVVEKLHGGTYQRSGLPDLYIAIGGVSLWVEMKRPGADTTKLQQRRLERLKNAGVYCGTAESPERVLEMIEEALVLYNYHIIKHVLGGK